MAMNIGPSRGVSANINMTPMIDVLLVLIIIFMVIQSVPLGLSANIPQPSSSASSSPSKTLVIEVEADGAIQLNQKPVTLDGLGAQLQEVFKTRDDKTCFVKASRGLFYEDVTRVIDAAKGAGAQRVGLM